MNLSLLAALLLAAPAAGTPEVVGQRPYEMVWAHRDKDDHPPLVDFEDVAGWRVETTESVATFVGSREQQLWGDYVGKLTYRGAGPQPQPGVPGRAAGLSPWPNGRCHP